MAAASPRLIRRAPFHIVTVWLLLMPSGLLPAQSYTSITVAGLGTVAGAADGTNGSARFYEPWSVALDNAGNVFVADSRNSAIRKLTSVGTNWVVTTVAGMLGVGGSTDVPIGITADNVGRIFVSDANSTIRKIEFFGTNCVVTTIAGQEYVSVTIDGTNTDAKFNSPHGIAADHAGNLYVAEPESNTIRKLAPVGTNWVVTTIAGLNGISGSMDGTNQDARFYAPFDIAADSAGNLYVPDYESSTIRKITPIGTNWVVSTIAGLAGSSGYADGTNDGARFSFPESVTVDGAANVYVADTGTVTVRKLTQIGTNWVVRSIVGLPWRWGYADGTGLKAQFGVPNGIAADSKGNLFMADARNDVILKIYPPPMPQISLFPNAVVLFWPAWGTDFYLETSAAISPAIWTPLTNEVTVSGSFLVLTNEPRNGAEFYRLNGP